jgi:16S rRNA (guanine527-N7)-methyltransferase
VRHGRAEELGHDPRWRNQVDLVTARAVASLPALLELGLPLLRTGGYLVLPKGLAIDEELVQATRAAALLGADIVSANPLPDVGSTINTRLVIVRKTATTPRTYPRRAGIPARTPLGTAPAKGSRPDPGGAP